MNMNFKSTLTLTSYTIKMELNRNVKNQIVMSLSQPSPFTDHPRWAHLNGERRYNKSVLCSRFYPACSSDSFDITRGFIYRLPDTAYMSTSPK